MSKLRHLMVINTFIWFNYACASLPEQSYYPKELLKNISKYSKNSTLSSELRKVLRYEHQETSDQDLIFENCPINQKCYKQSSNGSYRQARKYLFGKIALKKSSTGRFFVKDQYCDVDYDSSFGVGEGKIPDPKFMNCEHTWPQSRFSTNFSKSLQKNDLHHLYPVNSRANSARGNIIFGEVRGRVLSKDCQASSRGPILNSQRTVKAFEPPDFHKGNVARAIFYFSVRYKLPISSIEEEYLRKWHQDDPVDEDERLRNEEIYKIQRNRNPFIDSPDLVRNIKDF